MHTWDKTFGSDLIYVHTTFVERFEFHIHFIGSMNVDPFDEICKKRRKRVKSEFINSDEDWKVVLAKFGLIGLNLARYKKLTFVMF